jgi:nitrite reductase (NADH) small subunit
VSAGTVLSAGGRSPDTPAVDGHRLGPVDQIPFGEGRTFDVDGEQVAVFRLRSGRLHALAAVCPHRGGPIADGQLDDRVVLCPLHLNAFELATGCSTTGAEPLRRYDVHLDGDVLVVTL